MTGSGSRRHDPPRSIPLSVEVGGKTYSGTYTVDQG